MTHDETAGPGAQERLPLDLEGDPIPFSLTARARRAVAPDSLPDLAVVDDADASDTRPARARALRRAGASWERIAAELAVDELVVRSWVEDVSPGPTAPPRPHAGRTTTSVVDRRARDDFEAARERARREPDRHREEGAPPAGMGLLSGIVEVDEPAVVLAVDEPELAGAALAWLSRAVDLDPRDVRAVVRTAPRVAGDQAADRWRRALGLEGLRVITTHWSAAPHDEATSLLLRITDPTVAGTVAGWRDGLLAALASPDGGREVGEDVGPAALGA